MKQLKDRAIYLFSLLLLTSCQQPGGFFDQLSTSTPQSLSGYIVVASTHTLNQTTGPGLVSVWTPSGDLYSVIYDGYVTSRFPTGLALLDSRRLYILRDGDEGLDLYNFTTGSFTDIGAAGITGNPLRNIAVDASGSVYLAEGNANTIEKYDSSGVRVGAPFISSGGGCTLSDVHGITYVTSLDRIASVNRNNGLSIYNISGAAGTCYVYRTTSPFNGQAPTGLVYHPQTNKLLVTRTGDESIYTTDADGQNGSLVFLNASRVTDPWAIAVDTDGYVYVGAGGADTIEKFSFNGSTMVPVTSGPLIGPSAYTLNPTSIVVLP